MDQPGVGLWLGTRPPRRTWEYTCFIHFSLSFSLFFDQPRHTLPLSLSLMPELVEILAFVKILNDAIEDIKAKGLGPLKLRRILTDATNVEQKSAGVSSLHRQGYIDQVPPGSAKFIRKGGRKKKKKKSDSNDDSDEEADEASEEEAPAPKKSKEKSKAKSEAEEREERLKYCIWPQFLTAKGPASNAMLSRFELLRVSVYKRRLLLLEMRTGWIEVSLSPIVVTTRL